MNMDCDYFENHIREELEGAEGYAKAALELKASCPNWSKLFYEMCQQELNHARNFFDMFNEYYEKVTKPYGEIPKYFRDRRTEIIDLYTSYYAQVKCIHEMANK